ncbi:MAG: hypothetical protein ACRDA4_05205 [Filifactoraceae bacterium]
MIFNIIGFCSILLLLSPGMVYIYKYMFFDHSIVHDKVYNKEKQVNATAIKHRRKQKSPSSTVKKQAYSQKRVVNQPNAFTVKNVANPYDIYR